MKFLLAILCTLAVMARSFRVFFSDARDLARSVDFVFTPIFVHAENEKVIGHLNSRAKLLLWLGLGALTFAAIWGFFEFATAAS